jgi:hypothetical protein
MAQERRRVYYFLVNNIKKIIGEGVIENNIDNQQKENKNIRLDSNQN